MLGDSRNDNHPMGDARPFASVRARSFPVRRRRGRRHQPDVIAAVAVGGALGTWARRALTELWPASVLQMPWSTLVINLSGSLALGVVLFLAFERRPPNRKWRPFLAIGLLGGYTTFSSFVVQVVQLGQRRPLLAAAYLALSLIGGPLAILAGTGLTRRVLARPLDRTYRESRIEISESATSPIGVPHQEEP